MYFAHRFETAVCIHPVGTYNYTVVYLDESLFSELPLKTNPRLRIEADISGVPVKGAWQPARGKWYLMLPKAPLKHAGISVGDVVEVAFKVLPQDEVDIPKELLELLTRDKRAKKSWDLLTAGKQRSLAYPVAAAKRAETVAERLDYVSQVLHGEAKPPWVRKLG
jgi:hypothetical protein